MRLNRVLLLAATFSMMIFAMVFTISCSGDDGKDGKGCTVEEDGKDYKVLCGGKEVGVLKQGAKGDQGEPGTAVAKGDKGDPGPQGPKGETGSVDNLPGCLVKKVGATWHAFCDDNDEGVIGGNGNGGGGVTGGCSFDNEDQYNPHELVMDCPALTKPVYLCGGHLFDKSTHVCTSGKTRKSDFVAYDRTNRKWLGKYYFGTDHLTTTANLAASGLFPGQFVGVADTGMVGGLIRPLYALTNTNTTLSTSNRIFKCTLSDGTVEYDPNEKFCYRNSTGSTLVDLCSGATFDSKLAYDASTDDGKKHLYGNAIVIGTSCVGGKLIASCIDGSNKNTNPTTAGVINNEELDPTKLKNDSALALGKNRPLTFDPNTHFCRLKAVPGGEQLVEAIPLCNGKPYPNTQSCIEDVVKTECGTNSGVFFNDVTEFCWTATGKVGTKCSSDPSNYDPDKGFCSYGKAISTGSPPVNNGIYVENTDKEVPMALCNSTQKYNFGSWKWEYCVINGTGATQTQAYVTCGTNQKPQSTTGVTCQCIDGAAEVINAGVKRCLCLGQPEISTALATFFTGSGATNGIASTITTNVDTVYNTVTNVCTNGTATNSIDDGHQAAKCQGTYVLQVMDKDNQRSTCCPVYAPIWDSEKRGCVAAVCNDGQYLSYINATGTGSCITSTACSDINGTAANYTNANSSTVTGSCTCGTGAFNNLASGGKCLAGASVAAACNTINAVADTPTASGTQICKCATSVTQANGSDATSTIFDATSGKCICTGSSTAANAGTLTVSGATATCTK